MNRILKVVFNHVKGCFVAVSELTKSHSKNNKQLAKLLTILPFLLGGYAVAAITADTNIQAVGLANGWTVYQHATTGETLELYRLVNNQHRNPTLGTVVGVGSTDMGVGTVSFGIGSGSDSEWKFLSDLDGVQRFIYDINTSGNNTVTGTLVDVHRDAETGLMSIYKHSFTGQKSSTSSTTSDVDLFNSLSNLSIGAGSVISQDGITYEGIDTGSTRRLTGRDPKNTEQPL